MAMARIMCPTWPRCTDMAPGAEAFQTASPEPQAMAQASTLRWKTMATNGDGASSGYRTAAGSCRPSPPWRRSENRDHRLFRLDVSRDDFPTIIFVCLKMQHLVRVFDRQEISR